MLAAVYHGQADVRVEQIPLPELGADEILLKVVSASVCGTDLRIWHGHHRLYPPGTVRIPGHEVVGDIVQVGGQVRGVTHGQRVFVAPNMGCGHCKLRRIWHDDRWRLCGICVCLRRPSSRASGNLTLRLAHLFNVRDWFKEI